MTFRRTLTLLLALCLFMCFVSLAHAQLRLGHVASDTTTIGKAALRFADHLSQVSNEQMTVSIKGRSSLGGLVQLWVQLRTGALDFHVIDVAAAGLIQEANAFAVMWTPFLFRDQQHYRNYVDSDLFRAQMAEVEVKTRVRFIDLIGERSPRIISTTSKPVRTLADLRGLKIRVPFSPVFQITFSAWGAVPTPTKAAEIFTALMSGMVDGQDNGIVTIATTGLSKVIKHVTPINWSRSAIGLWMSSESWQKLSGQEQDWIRQSARLSRLDG